MAATNNPLHWFFVLGSIFVRWQGAGVFGQLLLSLSLSPEKNLAAPPDSAQSMHTALVVIHIEM